MVSPCPLAWASAVLAGASAALAGASVVPASPSLVLLAVAGSVMTVVLVELVVVVSGFLVVVVPLLAESLVLPLVLVLPEWVAQLLVVPDLCSAPPRSLQMAWLLRQLVVSPGLLSGYPLDHVLLALLLLLLLLCFPRVLA